MKDQGISDKNASPKRTKITLTQEASLRLMTSPLADRIQRPSRLNCRLNLRLREDFTIRDDDTFLTGVIHSRAYLRTHHSIFVPIHRVHRDVGGVGDLGKARSVSSGSCGAGPRAVGFPPAVVLANEAGHKA